MALSMNVYARVRKVLEGVDTSAVSDEEQLTVTPQLELLTATSAAPYREIVRMGRSFYTGTTSAVAAAVAIPTTGVMVALYNNAPDGGRSLIIDWIGVSGVAKTAAAGQQQMVVNLGQVREAAPTDAALAIKKANGYSGGTVDSVVRTILTTTALPAATGVAANWIPVGPSFGSPGAAATPGNGAWQAVDGRFVVPPGRYFAMHVVADVVGSTYQAFFGWSEALLLLG